MKTQVVHLQNPDHLALKNAYRSMPRNGEINLFISINNLTETLRSMESAGYAGIEIIYLNPSAESANIRAFKAKSGPCYDTGRFAVYQGAALAALDDDNHFLFANEKTPVCEKTANIYKLPAYERIIKCNDADPGMVAKLNSDPEIFSCDSFEDDQEKLFQMLKNIPKVKGSVNLFYPGPFRLLILRDGRIVKRGQLTLVPASDAKHLITKDRLFKLFNSSTLQPTFFTELYSSYGPGCLMDIHPDHRDTQRVEKPDLTRLDKLSQELKKHLLEVIKQKKKYFILTGSDTRNKLGCCPSEVVTAANELKSAGILDSFQQSVPDETCPLTIYAFRNEINIIENNLQFNIDNDFRQLILNYLENKTNFPFRLYARWILVAFILITLLIALSKINRSSSPSDTLSLYEQLVPRNKDQQMILLFHYSERCEMCLNMEKFTNEVLNEDYPEMVPGKKIQFKLITMDKPSNSDLVERFGLFTTTIVLVKFENRQEKKIKVLSDSWKYYQDENLFKKMLRNELGQFK